jgi:uncharacterized protein YbaA (DUF1428 family)
MAPLRRNTTSEDSIMAKYIDAFVLPVPTAKLDDYRKLAQIAGKVWREYGALEYIELIADDVQPGKQTSFPQSVDLKAGEVVMITYITYESREHRDRVNEQVMKDPRIAGMDPKAFPFDAMRMFWGGFKSWLEV